MLQLHVVVIFRLHSDVIDDFEPVVIKVARAIDRVGLWFIINGWSFFKWRDVSAARKRQTTGIFWLGVRERVAKKLSSWRVAQMKP